MFWPNWQTPQCCICIITIKMGIVLWIVRYCKSSCHHSNYEQRKKFQSCKKIDIYIDCRVLCNTKISAFFANMENLWKVCFSQVFFAENSYTCNLQFRCLPHKRVKMWYTNSTKIHVLPTIFDLYRHTSILHKRSFEKRLFCALIYFLEAAGGCETKFSL